MTDRERASAQDEETKPMSDSTTSQPIRRSDSHRRSVSHHTPTMRCARTGAHWLLGRAVAAAQHLRTARRLRMIGIVMFALLATSCAIGVLQQTSKNRKPFGIVPMSNATPVLRDVYSTETAIGLAAYRSWDEVPASLGMRPSIANSSAYFAPVAAATQPFAGFLQRQQWTICCIAVIPLLLTFAAQFLVQASAYGATDWPWTWEGKRALLWFAGALSLGGLATWFGDPIVVPAAVLAAAIAAAILAGPERGQAIRWAAVLWVVVVGVGAIRLGTAGGMQALQDRIAVASSDNRSLWSAFLDHRWFGCGLGASGELWTLYRSNPSDKPMQASSLLAAAVELGWLGMGIVAAVGLYSTGKWLWVRGRLDAQARLLVGGAASAVFAMTAFAALGPGLEAPVLLGIAAVLVGCLARGLSGGYCNFGGLES